MKVWPTSEDKRRVLVHPTGGAFREIGPAEWPEDTWTFRRIRDGDVTTEEPKEEKQRPKPASQKE